MYMGGRYQHSIYMGGSITPSSLDSLLGVISHQAARMSHVPGKDRSHLKRGILAGFKSSGLNTLSFLGTELDSKSR